VQRAVAAPARSSLDLLSLPYPFSQVGLLSANDFVSQANRRRSRASQSLPSIDVQMLEELHRTGILVPLFRVDLGRSPESTERAIDLSQSQTAKQVRTTVINELLRGAAEGRVLDPAAEAFVRWPQERRRDQWPSVDSGYLYSRHQLLGVDVAMCFVSDLKPRRNGDSITWHLDEANLPNQPTREALASWRGLTITLIALDTYYWPQMTHVVRHGLTVWRVALQAFDPAQMLAWLGLSLDEITRQAGSLKAWASMRDNTGDFYEVIRRAKAEAWDSLRGDAASAMDYRLAADILDRYAEDLNPGSDYAAGHSAPLSQQGLSARPESLDGALTALQLSPFPSLVIGVEGETEHRLVPQVMKLLDIGLDPNWIRIVDFEGTGNLSLLARYAAEPVLGRDFGTGVALDRPLTRFLVLADAENKFKEAADRRKQRRLLIESLTKNVPLDLRSDYYINTRRDRIVEIRTWGKLPFEFAHFKDAELADAMLDIAKVPHPEGRSVLIRNLRAQRARSAPDVAKVFWGPQSGLTKPALADALRPVLEAKINKAIREGKKGPPVMQACVRAYEMASVTYGLSMMLRRRRWRPRR
jgi:hypothetical protein